MWRISTLIMDRLLQFGIVPMDSSTLKSVFSTYGFPSNKISNLERSGNLIRLKRGLYAVSPDKTSQPLSLELIANHLYGPSYLSKEYALSYYGLIPERVYEVQSMTTKRSRQFVNELATFSYTETPANYFSIGIRQISTDLTFLIASPEKALCDLIAYTQGLRIQSLKGMQQYLEEDIRFDTSELTSFDASLIQQCAQFGKKKHEMSLLLKLLNK